MEVRTRIAPSPTGYAHLGTIYQAMFDFCLAKKAKGKFIVRIEDTDRARFVEGAEEVVFSALEWFGLTPDEDPIKGGPFAPYRQSERLDIYRKYVNLLLEKGHAYHCFCTKERLAELRISQEKDKLPPMYDKCCLGLSADQIKENLDNNMPYVIRMKIPKSEVIKVHDSLVGDIEFDSNLIDDQVLLKADGFPTYHLAVVVDDYLMKITNIIRGKEWLPSTPKHILLYRFFGWEDSIPKYTHLPVILNADGKGKLSKRDGHASVDFYKKEGFLPEAILNYLSNIVWNHPDGKEIYDLKELEKAIDINSPKIINITSQAPRFDLKKLEWMNGEYIRKMSDEDLTKRLEDFLVDHPAPEIIAPLVPLVKERIKKLSDFILLTNFITEAPEYDMEVFKRIKVENQKDVLQNIYEELQKMEKPWKSEVFEKTFKDLAQKLDIKAGDMFQLIRVAVSGQLVTPPLFESIQILGEEETIKRVASVVQKYPLFD
ncbi:MAG: glutamate--tRNA ligase [Candidatus Daviesbacteria bacterium]|nr:glutamate--tRNA ligase [Candidatus Daviesbacteria bacterium]